MNRVILKISTSKAALTVGIAFITSVILVTIVDDVLLANFVVPGDTEQLARDIRDYPNSFGFAAVGYLFVLALDSIIGLALYVVLKSSSKIRAFLTAALRLLYAAILIVGVLALVFKWMDAYGYASLKLVGYVFFALHLLVLGYSVIKSGYIPKSLGVILIIASCTYIIFFVEIYLPESVMVLAMLTMAIAELSLSIWLIVKRNSLPDNVAIVTPKSS